MVTITDSTLRQNVYETLYDTVTGVTIASSLLHDSTKSVTYTAAFVESDAKMPQVVLYSPDVSQGSPSFGTPLFQKDVKFLVEVYAKYAKDKDVIMDSIVNTISTTSWSGFHLIGSDESNALSPVSNLKVHMKSATFTFVRR